MVFSVQFKDNIAGEKANKSKIMFNMMTEHKSSAAEHVNNISHGCLGNTTWNEKFNSNVHPAVSTVNIFNEEKVSCQTI